MRPAPDAAVPAQRRPRIALPSTLRTTLIVPYVLLTLLTAIIGIFIVMRLVAASARERFFSQLSEASRVVADGLVRRERAHLDTLRRLANTDGVPQAMADEDLDALDRLLGPLVLNDRIEVLTVVNRAGIEERTYILNPDEISYTLTSKADLSREPLVTRVLNGDLDEVGDKFAGVRGLQSGAFLFTSAPVRDAAGQIVGGMLMGTRLETLLAELNTQAQSHGVIALDENGKITAMTLIPPDEGTGLLELTAVEADFLGASVIKERTLYGYQYQLLYAPLIVREQRVGVVAVALRSDYIVSTEITSRDTFALIFGVGTAVMIVAGLALSHYIAAPILRLRSVSQAVAGGDLDQQSKVQRRDEIGDLAKAFDTMIARLRERTAEARRLYQETVQRNRELADSNAKLQSAQQQLVQSEKLAAVGQLTAGIVHDVKNPLAVIKGLSEILQEEDDLTAFTREQLVLIRDNASRANTIVSDLLKFARQSTPEMGVRDLRETLQAALRLTEYLVRKGRVHPRLELPDTAVHVMYDAQQIEQVLVNLIQNAVQAMPSGGELVLRLQPDGSDVVIEVRDTGTGIAPENLRRIFDPFFTTKPEGEGTGLGLSVSYGIIARHHGEITVTSAVGRGTTFSIRLPVTQPEANLSAGDGAYVG